MTNKGQVSFIRSGSVSLSRTCSQTCAYCGFKGADDFILPLSDLHDSLYKVRMSGATEVVFCSGDAPQEYPLIQIALKREGFASYLEYLEQACKLALTYELLPVLSVGFLDLFASKRLAHVTALARISAFATDLFAPGQAHENARRRTQSVCKSAIENARLAGLPYSLEIILGIGESKDRRLKCIEDYGRQCAPDPLLQEIRLIPFQPVPSAIFHDRPPLSFEQVADIFPALHEAFPVHPISIPTHLFSRYPELVEFGLNDLGSLPDSTQDPVMPTFPVPSFDTAKKRLLERNYFLAERLSVLTAAAIQRRAIAVVANACHRRLNRRDTLGLDLIDNHQCFVCGDLNKTGLKLSFSMLGKNTCTAIWVSEARFQGYAGILHGGIIATLLDEVMAHSLIGSGLHVVTADFSVRFLHPAPIGVPLTIIGTSIGKKQRIHLTKGSIRLADGTILAEAEGKYSEY